MMRHTIRTRAGLVAATALIAAPVFAGCTANVGGTTQVGSAASQGNTAHSSTKANATAKVLPVTLNLADTAKAVTQQRFVRVKVTVDASFGGMASGSMATTVTEDTKSGNIEATGSFSGMIGAQDDNSSLGEYTMRVVDGEIYLRMASMDKWFKVDADFPGTALAAKPLTAQSLLDGFAKAGVTMTKSGTVAQNGATLTRYTGTFSMEDLLASMKNNGAELQEFLGSGTNGAAIQANATMLVDGSGRPVQVKVNTSLGGDHKGTFGLTADFLDVTGTPDISAPPASDVTDMKSGLEGLLAGGN